MEFKNITTKIDNTVDKWLKDFEAKPISTSLKLVVVYWIVKKVYETFLKDK